MHSNENNQRYGTVIKLECTSHRIDLLSCYVWNNIDILCSLRKHLQSPWLLIPYAFFVVFIHNIIIIIAMINYIGHANVNIEYYTYIYDLTHVPVHTFELHHKVNQFSFEYNNNNNNWVDLLRITVITTWLTFDVARIKRILVYIHEHWTADAKIYIGYWPIYID